MKKLITVISILFLFLFATSAFADDYVAAYIFPEELPVYTAPTEESRVMDTVYGGQEMEVVDIQGDWAKICITLDSYGWINAYNFEYHIYLTGDLTDYGFNYDEDTQTYTRDEEYYYEDYSSEIDYAYDGYVYEPEEKKENEDYDNEDKVTNDYESEQTQTYYNEEEEQEEEEQTVVKASTAKSASTSGMSIVDYALQFVGNPYVYGGTSLTDGTDCSGFTQSVFRDNGIDIPRASYEQAESGEEVDLDDIQEGDLLFYYDEDKGRIGHVTIYAGDDKVVHASNPTNGILVSDMDYRTPVSARRYWTEEDEDTDSESESEPEEKSEEEEDEDDNETETETDNDSDNLSDDDSEDEEDYLVDEDEDGNGTPDNEEWVPIDEDEMQE